MPRGPRIDAPGAWHHVMVRGVERREIFMHDSDREVFLSRLGKLVPELGFRCFAWALMPNHVHLVVQTADVPLSTLMARLFTSYSMYFNRCHERVGHLVQNRFKSRLVADDADLKGLIRYVHRNPIEAGIVSSVDGLESHPWTGHAALVGAMRPRPFECPAEVQALFAESRGEAIEDIRRRLAWEEAPATEPDQSSAATRIKCDAHVDPPTGLRSLVRSVNEKFSLEDGVLCGPSRNRAVAEARAELVYQAISVLGLAGREIARELGITQSGVSRAWKRAIRNRNQGVAESSARTVPNESNESSIQDRPPSR